MGTSVPSATSFHNRPCAVAPLTSYRYPSNDSGWIMSGATDHEDAIREANRSLSHPNANVDLLEVWNGSRYVLAGQ